MAAVRVAAADLHHGDVIVGDRETPDRLIITTPDLYGGRVHMLVRYTKSGVVVRRNTSFKPASLVKIHDRA